MKQGEAPRIGEPGPLHHPVGQMGVPWAAQGRELQSEDTRQSSCGAGVQDKPELHQETETGSHVQPCRLLSRNWGTSGGAGGLAHTELEMTLMTLDLFPGEGLLPPVCLLRLIFLSGSHISPESFFSV